MNHAVFVLPYFYCYFKWCAVPDILFLEKEGWDCFMLNRRSISFLFWLVSFSFCHYCFKEKYTHHLTFLYWTYWDKKGDWNILLEKPRTSYLSMGASCCSCCSRMVWYSFSYFFSFFWLICWAERVKQQMMKKGNTTSLLSLV